MSNRRLSARDYKSVRRGGLNLARLRDLGMGLAAGLLVALLFWLYGSAMWASLCALGMFTWGFFALSACVSLVTLLVTANVGAMLYKEE